MELKRGVNLGILENILLWGLKAGYRRQVRASGPSGFQPHHEPVEPGSAYASGENPGEGDPALPPEDCHGWGRKAGCSPIKGCPSGRATGSPFSPLQVRVLVSGHLFWTPSSKRGHFC